jgi:hypothetical protein
VHGDNIALLQEDDDEFDAALDEETVGANIMMKYLEMVVR